MQPAVEKSSKRSTTVFVRPELTRRLLVNVFVIWASVFDLGYLIVLVLPLPNLETTIFENKIPDNKHANYRLRVKHYNQNPRKNQLNHIAR